jgi:hypothetical protein
MSHREGLARGFLADQGFSPPYKISYRGVKLPRVSEALGGSDLRYRADFLPRIGDDWHWLMPPIDIFTAGAVGRLGTIEMSQSSWLVAGVLPGIERQPRKEPESNAESNR